MKTSITLAFIGFALTFACSDMLKPDTTPPTVVINLPQNGVEVSGVTLIRATASDNVGILRVVFYIDGVEMPESIDDTDPFQYPWDTTSLGPGTEHTISARAYDTSENFKDSDEITVTVNNDLKPPSIVIITPAEQDMVQEIVQVKVIAVDNNGITEVRFRIDGEIQDNGVDMTEPYEFAWNTVTYENGSTHVITAEAYDIGNNVTISPPVTVTVDNSTAVPKPVSINNIEYNEGTYVITWEKSSDSDFAAYELYESFSPDFDDSTLVFNTTNQDLTTFTANDIKVDDERYYRVTVIDTLGLSSAGPIASAMVNFALQFDGINDYVDFGQNVLIDQLNFTLEVWVLMSGQGGGLYMQNTIYQQRMDATGDNLPDVGLISRRQDGDAAFTIRSTDGSADNVHSTAPPYGEWHHFAGTVDDAEVRLYIDGVLVHSTPNTQRGTLDAPIDYVHLGRHRYLGIDAGFLYGMIDELRIWDHPRTQQEIVADMHHKLTGDEAGLIAYFPFNGTGQTVIDVVGNHNGLLGATDVVGSDDPKRVSAIIPRN